MCAREGKTEGGEGQKLGGRGEKEGRRERGKAKEGKNKFSLGPAHRDEAARSILRQAWCGGGIGKNQGWTLTHACSQDPPSQGVRGII